MASGRGWCIVMETISADGEGMDSVAARDLAEPATHDAAAQRQR